MNATLRAKKERIIATYGEPKDLDDLARCCIAMMETYDNAVQPRDRRRKRVPPEYLKIAGFAWDIKYGVVDNYHQTPIDGTSRYSPGKEPQHLEYTGWTGRVWVRYATSINSFGSDPMSNTLTYTGSGGAGSYSGPWDKIAKASWFSRTKHPVMDPPIPEPHLFSWDFRFFASDWPLIAHDFEKQVAWGELQNKPLQNRDHRFRWTDPEVAAQDEANLKALDLHQFINKAEYEKSYYAKVS